MRLLACVMASLWLAASPSAAQDPLTVVGDLSGMVDAYLTEIARALWSERDAAIASLDTRSAVEARQAYIRQQLEAAIGGFPERTPLNSRITGTLQRDGYRVEKLLFESQPGFYVTANVYVPSAGTPPYPALLGTAGHLANGKAGAIYQRVWISMVKRGFLVLAYDPPGQGERAQYFDPVLGRSRVGIGVPEHIAGGLQCLLTGTHYARYETWDGICAVDYLVSRSDVDPDRIAVAGNSGGGTQTAYLAALEPRLAAAMSGCYITSWKQLWFDPGPQDAEQVLTDFLADGLGFGDFAIAFAPRPFQILAATRDFFPIQGTRATFDDIRRIYGLLDAPDAAGFFEYDDTHGWSKPRREAASRWLERWFHGRNVDGSEPAIETELESDLYVTATGQVATSLDATTVQSLNADLAKQVYSDRRILRVDEAVQRRRLIAARLRIRDEVLAGRDARHISPRGTVARDGYRIEKAVITTEPGIEVPVLVFVPERRTSRRPAVLYIHESGKAADAGAGSDIEALVGTGHVVLAADPRGVGESAVGRSRFGYSSTWYTSQRALLVGKTMVGMQVEDLLGAFDYLAAARGGRRRPDRRPWKGQGRRAGVDRCGPRAACEKGAHRKCGAVLLSHHAVEASRGDHRARGAWSARGLRPA